jgi:hypothetical protein
MPVKASDSVLQTVNSGLKFVAAIFNSFSVVVVSGMGVLQHLHIANSSLIFFDTSFAVRRNFWCSLYRAEYKYSGLVLGKFGICEGDSGNRVGCGKVMFLLIAG